LKDGDLGDYFGTLAWGWMRKAGKGRKKER